MMIYRTEPIDISVLSAGHHFTVPICCLICNLRPADRDTYNVCDTVVLVVRSQRVGYHWWQAMGWLSLPWL